MSRLGAPPPDAYPRLGHAEAGTSHDDGLRDFDAEDDLAWTQVPSCLHISGHHETDENGVPWWVCNDCGYLELDEDPFKGKW